MRPFDISWTETSMDLTRYRPAIIKALKAIPPNSPPEKTVDMILFMVDLARELMGEEPTSEIRRDIDVPIIGGGLAGGIAAAQSFGQPPPSSRGIAPLTPSAPATRIKPQAVKKADVQYYTVDEILEYVEQNAPPTLELDLGDSKPPLKLSRKVRPMKFEFMGATDIGGEVQLSYLLPGEREDNSNGTRIGDGGVMAIPPPVVSFATTTETINLQKGLDELIAANRSRASREPRTIAPRSLPPVAMTLDAALRSPMSAQEDSTVAQLEMSSPAPWRNIPDGAPMPFRK